MAMLDLRRTDLRGTTLENPYWVTSAEIAIAAEDTQAVLFSFPATGGATPNKGRILITLICCEIITGFDNTPSMTIGTGSLATDAVTTAGTCTVVDADDFFPSASITETTPGVYWPAAGDWFDAMVAATIVDPVVIVAADTTVPVVYAALTSATACTVGAARVHMLVHRLPLLG